MNPSRAIKLLEWANNLPPQELYNHHVWLSLWAVRPGHGREEVSYPGYHRRPVAKDSFVVEKGGPLDQPASVLNVAVNVPNYHGLRYVGLSLVEATHPILFAKLEPGTTRPGYGGMLSIDPGLRFVLEVRGLGSCWR